VGLTTPLVPTARTEHEGRLTMRVLHVSEALGGGITSSLLAMVEATPEIDHHLIARPRTAHDTGADLEAAFATVHLLPGRPAAAVRALRGLARELFPDIVHAHSSVAGAVARVAGLDRVRVVYSPHCFAFERRDLSGWQRRLFEGVERSLAPRTDLLLAVSPSEVELGAELGHREIAYAPNRTPAIGALRAQHCEPLHVVAVGRLCRQKDWRYFLHVKRYAEAQLGLRASWEWLGGGDRADEQALAAEGVTVSGWIDRDELLHRMARAQVYLHTAAWEAAPISILEAAGIGLPLALRSIVPLDSLNLPGRHASVPDLAGRILRLQDRDEWRLAQHAALAVAERHSEQEQGRLLVRAYERVLGQADGPARSDRLGAVGAVSRLSSRQVIGPRAPWPHVAVGARP
jgi:glycosyltransferase involved in cell wall biosynthesis